mgnify:CR=1 FL=1
MRRPFREKKEVKMVNRNIPFKMLRLIDEEGQLGIMTLDQAINVSTRRQMDVVLINEKADPPVAKILQASKYFYEQKKKEKEAAKRQRGNKIVIKEVQFRLNIDTNDFDTKLRNIERFLSKGNKVKCIIRYKGRENANKQVGFELMDKIINSIENTGWDSKPSLNGNRLIGILMRKE